jgi:hypothetical protein
VPIRDFCTYLYRTFRRTLAAHRKTELRLEEAFEDHFRMDEDMSVEQKTVSRRLLKQILRDCDRETTWIIWERVPLSK